MGITIKKSTYKITIYGIVSVVALFSYMTVLDIYGISITTSGDAFCGGSIPCETYVNITNRGNYTITFSSKLVVLQVDGEVNYTVYKADVRYKPDNPARWKLFNISGKSLKPNEMWELKIVGTKPVGKTVYFNLLAGINSEGFYWVDPVINTTWSYPPIFSGQRGICWTTNKAHAVWISSNISNRDLQYAYSTNGLVWITNKTFGNETGDKERPSIDCEGNNVVVAYAFSNYFVVGVSTDEGSTWTWKRAYTDEQYYGATSGLQVMLRGQRIYLMWTSTNGCLKMGRSDDLGDTWNSVVTVACPTPGRSLNYFSYDVSGKGDNFDFILVVGCEVNASGSLVYSWNSIDGGNTFNSGVFITNYCSNAYPRYPSVAIDQSNSSIVHVAFGSSANKICYARSDNRGGSWNPSNLLISDSDTGNRGYPTLTLDSLWKPWVFWWDDKYYSTGGIVYNRWNGTEWVGPKNATEGNLYWTCPNSPRKSFAEDRVEFLARQGDTSSNPAVNWTYNYFQLSPPTVSLFVNGKTTDLNLESMEIVNITGIANDDFLVCLSSNHTYLGERFVCGKKRVEYLFNLSASANKFNNTKIAENFTYSSQVNHTITLRFHKYDVVNNVSLNLTGFNTTYPPNYPTNVKIYVNDSLSNYLSGIISEYPAILDRFLDGNTTKNITFVGAGSKVEYIRLPKNSVVTNATFTLKGYSTSASRTVYFRFNNSMSCWAGYVPCFETFLDLKNCYDNGDKYFETIRLKNWYSESSSGGGKSDYFVDDDFSDSIVRNYTAFKYYASGSGQISEASGYLTFNSKTSLNDMAYLYGGYYYVHIGREEKVKFNVNIVSLMSSSYVTPIGYIYTPQTIEEIMIGIHGGNVYIVYKKDSTSYYWTGSSWTTTPSYCGTYSTNTWYSGIEMSVQRSTNTTYNLKVQSPFCSNAVKQITGASPYSTFGFIVGDAYSYGGYEIRIDDLEMFKGNWELSGTAISANVTKEKEYVSKVKVTYYHSVPSGTEANYYVSVDGINWESVANNTWKKLNYGGDKLKLKIVLSKLESVDASPKVANVTLEIPNHYPLNPYIDVSSDGLSEWIYAGELTGQAGSSNLADAINYYLSICLPDSYGYCDVPIAFGSEATGILEVSKIEVEYYVKFNPIYLRKELIQNYLNNSPYEYVDVPIKIETDKGKLMVYDVRVSYFGVSGINVSAVVLWNKTIYSDTKNIRVYFSRFEKKLPYSFTTQLIITPMSNSSKNVTPYGQTDSVPIFNISWKNYHTNAGLLARVNETSSCLTYTLSNSSSKENGIVLDTTYKYILYNRAVNTWSGLWLWVDFENCNASEMKTYIKRIDLRSVCSVCDV